MRRFQTIIQILVSKNTNIYTFTLCSKSATVQMISVMIILTIKATSTWSACIHSRGDCLTSHNQHTLYKLISITHIHITLNGISRIHTVEVVNQNKHHCLFTIHKLLRLCFIIHWNEFHIQLENNINSVDMCAFLTVRTQSDIHRKLSIQTFQGTSSIWHEYLYKTKIWKQNGEKMSWSCSRERHLWQVL